MPGRIAGSLDGCGGGGAEPRMSADYSERPLSVDPTTLDGLSEKLITSHHANNYGGAVKRLNAILTERQAPGFVVEALKREELIAANSAFLHVEAFMRNVDWKKANARYARAAE
jgi:superoxide dismutase